MMKAFKVRFWMEMLVLASAIACVLAILIATLGVAGAGAKEPQASTAGQSSRVGSDVHLQTYDGVITDTHCGAKHSAPLAETAADCTRMCVHAGDHFALVDGDKMYVLEGEAAALKHAAGERVRIAGTLDGNTISVTSVGVPAS